MAGTTYKQIMVTGTSSESMEDAVEGAIASAAKTLRNLSWFEVVEMRGALKDQKLLEYQVVVRIGFALEE